ncbi:hypothetical protein H4S02_005838, partial [Coemansia sp. RSA 2611]
MDTSNANIPTALRHLLARGVSPQHELPDHYHSATSSATTLQNLPNTRLNLAKSTGNLRSGSTLGAWLSKYHLRPGGTRPSAKETLSRSHAGHSQSSIASDHALSAYITSVETREAGGSGTGGELRVSSLRMGRKRFLVYRVLVTGHTGQWWVARRYSEFSDLYQHLRRQFPQRAHMWGEFPSKRLLPGLGSSADSVMQRRERLNSFLRALIQDPEVTAHVATQQFLRDDPLDPDAVPLAERAAVEKDASLRRNFGGIEPLAHASQGRQPTKRSVSGGSALTELKAPWETQISDRWSPAPPPVPRARESIERMASMPALKSAGKPDFDFSVPLPTQPFSATSGRDHMESQQPPGQEPAPMFRKISDPLEYASAEKRPTAVAPQSMRKKYGFRRNVQYRNDRYDGKNRVGSSSQPQIPLPPPPDTGATMMEPQSSRSAMNWESDYVIVDDNIGGQMDLDMTLRAGSVDSELDASTRSLQAAKRGRKLAALRRTPLGGLGKSRAPANDEQAVAAAKRLHGSGPGAENAADDRDDDADARGRSPKPSVPQKIGLDDFQLLSIIGKGSYGQVMLARYKDSGKVMAIKVISKSKLRGRPSEIRRVMSERKVLERTVRHPFLVGLQCAFQTKEKLFFCLDYVNGGEL